MDDAKARGRIAALEMLAVTLAKASCVTARNETACARTSTT